jgi:putative endonuclease
VPRRPRGWRVYILRCGDGTLYTGATNDLARRVEAHALGRGARYTRARLPVLLLWSAPARGRGGAQRREAAIKRLPRAGKLALVAAGESGRPPPEARLRIDTHRARAGTMRKR